MDTLRFLDIMGFAVGLIYLILEYRASTTASVVVTGENASMIVPNCRRSGVILDEDLVMYGLWSIWKRNREAN